MKQIHLAFLVFATSSFCLTISDSTNSGYKRDISSPSQTCIKRSLNGKTNGLSQNWYYGFSNACKNALYPDLSQGDKDKDDGSWPQAFRFDADNWAARFEVAAPTPKVDYCTNMKMKCRDLVGHNADGRGSQNDLGKNFEHCWPITDDKVYHGGETTHIYITETSLSYQMPVECGTMKIWRCRDGECGADFDAANDPHQTGTVM